MNALPWADGWVSIFRITANVNVLVTSSFMISPVRRAAVHQAWRFMRWSLDGNSKLHGIGIRSNRSEAGESIRIHHRARSVATERPFDPCPCAGWFPVAPSLCHVCQFAMSQSRGSVHFQCLLNSRRRLRRLVAQRLSRCIPSEQQYAEADLRMAY